MAHWSYGDCYWAMSTGATAAIYGLLRSLSFGSVANQYERYRPDYPDGLVEAVEQYAGRPLGSALEVGAGTGKATW